MLIFYITVFLWYNIRTGNVQLLYLERREITLKNQINAGCSFEERLNIFPELFSTDPCLYKVPDILEHYKSRLTDEILHGDSFRPELVRELSDWIDINGETAIERELKFKKGLLEVANSQKDFHSFVRNIATLQGSYSNQITDLKLLEDMRYYFNELYNRLVELGLFFELSGRRKALMSFEEKLFRNALNGKAPNSLKDIFAFRIVLFDTDDKCYDVMEHVIDFFEERDCLLDDPTPLKDISTFGEQKPRIQKVKDYIKNPKTSGYQSLHALFVTSNGYYFELQVRTLDMHLIAEEGSAAHDGIYKSADGYLGIIPKIHMQGFTFKQTPWGKLIYMDKTCILHSVNIFNRQRTF